MYEVTVKSQFSGAHFLNEYKGQCENLHGHNWLVETTLSGENLDKAGMLYDFKLLKHDLKQIINELDHTLINEHPDFKDQNPSAELIARFIFTRLRDILKVDNVTVKEVCVHESSNSRAVYRES